MVTIEVSTVIRNNPGKVFSIMRDFEQFPQFMRDVKLLKIIKRLPDAIVTAWEINIEGAPVAWKEKDIFSEDKHQINFDLVEGDYKGYRGFWLAQPHHNGTKLTIKADFDWGIPVLEKYVHRSLENKARRGLLGMVLAVKKKAENPDV